MPRYEGAGRSVFLGGFIYAWTTIEQHNMPWIAPCLGIGIFSIGLFHVYLAVFNYLADGGSLFQNLVERLTKRRLISIPHLRKLGP